MNNIARKMRRALVLLLELIKYETASLCALALKTVRPEYRGLWLVAERGREARDNAYHLFAYIRREHPEQNVCYVADKALPDYERVRAIGNVVQYRSFAHYVLCAASDVKISTHILGYTPSIENYYMLDKLHIVRGKKAFLQHGVTCNDIAWYHYPNVRTDLFVCALEKEREFVEKTFAFPSDVVWRLGFCRFDALLRPCPRRRQLLFMPTWRAYAVEGKTREQFCASEYFQRWQALLAAPELDELLEKYRFEAVFYPHYEVQKFLDSFRTPSPRVRTAALGQADVQTLLMESAVLVTDFSSVQFDFAYMRKPVFYYAFDEARFWGEHYGRGYFSPREDGFGPVLTQQRELLREIEAVLARDCAPEEVYLRRAEALFTDMDGGACERNYRAIMELCAR